MTGKELLRAIGDIDESLIEEAAPAAVSKPPVKIALRRAARVLVPLAAAVAVGLFFGIRYYSQRQIEPDLPPALSQGGPESDGTDTLLPGPQLLEYGGCYYEAVDAPETLEKYGLPAELTDDLAGERVSYLRAAGEAGFETAEDQTGTELLRYAPAPCDGVYIIREGDRYSAAVFCNVLHYENTNETTELEQLYRIYGIGSAVDIASVTAVDWNGVKETGAKITDRDEISDFYRLTTETQAVGNEDFQNSVFGDIPEAEQAQAHAEFADDLKVLRIETKDGLRFYLDVHPSYGWIYGGGTLTYYRIPEGLADWLRRGGIV